MLHSSFGLANSGSPPGYTQYTCGALTDFCVQEIYQTNESRISGRGTTASPPFNHGASRDHQAQSRILGTGLLELLDNCHKLQSKFLFVLMAIMITTTQQMTRYYGITAISLFPIVCHNRSLFLFLGLSQMMYPRPDLRTGASLQLPCGSLVMQTAVFSSSPSFS